MSAQRFLKLGSIAPPGPGIIFDLLGDVKLSRSGAGKGGWQVTDRPKRQSVTTWVAYSPFTMSMELIMDGMSGRTDQSVEPQIKVVEGWELPVPGTVRTPVLALGGPVPHSDLPWVVQTLSWAECIRDPATGLRVQQHLSLTLLEYVPPVLSVRPTSPAVAAQRAQATTSTAAPSGRSYTVRSGDTLSAIAARLLHDYRRWPDIARANNLRDPNYLRVGQVLAIPS